MLEHVKRAFEEYFSHWSIELPEETMATRSRGEIRQAGWTIRFLFDRDGDREYLDFYAMHRMTNDRHARIYEDGQVEHLESIWDTSVHNPEIPGDEERARREYIEHNRRVSEALKKKGFL
jgi:hypothetical protein